MSASTFSSLAGLGREVAVRRCTAAGLSVSALQKAASISHSKYHCLGPSDNKAFYNVLASHTLNTSVLHGSKALRGSRYLPEHLSDKHQQEAHL